MATRMKAKLQSAADAASIAALSQKSPGFLAASVMTGNGTVAAGVTDATNVFNANMDGITGYQNLVTKDIAVTKTGIKLAASVTFTADVPTTFLKVINYSKLTVSGLSSSAATLPPYLDFYLTLDVSGSMGLAVDGRRTDAAFPGQPGQLSPISHRLHFRLPFRSKEQRLHRYRDPGISNERRLSGLRDLACQPKRLQGSAPEHDGEFDLSCGQEIHISNTIRTGLPNSLYFELGDGFILRHRRHRRLHPVARRRGRLRREPIVHYRERLHRRSTTSSGSVSTRSFGTSTPIFL